MTATEAPAELAGAVTAGDRRALARAITLVESTRPDHRTEAIDLVEAVLPRTGSSVRLGVSGPPGVGKSTFIEAFGMHLISEGHRVAVLAVDPTSSRSGGSILGDKTRMETLARHPDAYVRPSPSGGELGGVARRTREALLVCEAAGFDVVVVETVGVGQSEVAVAELTDLFVLLASPTGGDELQGIKRGIMELADLVLVTKADGDLAQAAANACADIRRALRLLRPRHAEIATQALCISATEGSGVAEVWSLLAEARRTLEASGSLSRLRAEQARAWLWSELRGSLELRLRTDARVAASLPAVEAEVTAGTLTPSAGAARLLDRFGT